MQKFFSLSRIKLSEIFTDTYNYLRNVYKSSDVLFSSASPWGQILSVINRLFGMNLYYIEDSITELNINSASRPNSIFGLARLAGHEPTRAMASTGILSLQYNGTTDGLISDIIIPNYIRIKCTENNLSYIGVFGNDSIKISVNKPIVDKVQFRVYQGRVESQQFTGTGEALQSYECNMREGDWIDNNYVNVYVNGDKFKIVSSLYDMSLQEKACIVRTGLTSGIDIFFGNESFGYIPELGSEIFVEYLVTEGSLGDVSKSNLISFKFEDMGYDQSSLEVDLNTFFNLKMVTSIDMGTIPESVELTKIIAPATSRSMVLAQTTNYEVFFEKMQLFSYIKIYTEYNIFDPYVDNIIYMLLVPDLTKRVLSNEDYFSLPIERFQLTNYEKYNLYQRIEKSGEKIFGTVPYFVDPIFKKYGMNIYLKIWSGSDVTQTKKIVQNSVSTYLLNFRRIDYVPKSDLISIIEGISQVDSVAIDFFSEDVETLFNCLYKGNIINLYDKFGIELDAYEYEILNLYLEISNDSETAQSDLAEMQNWGIDTYSLTTNKSYKTISNSTKQEAFEFFMSIDSIKNYINSKYDQFGNIILNKNEYPIFRGGYNDRFDNKINDKILTNRLCAINIYYEFVEKTYSQKINNQTINDLRSSNE
jgi:hypothetical protein